MKDKLLTLLGLRKIQEQTFFSPFSPKFNRTCTLPTVCMHGGDTYTVEPPIKDTPNKGHNRKNLSIKDTFYGPKVLLSYYTNTFLTSEERTTSL